MFSFRMWTRTLSEKSTYVLNCLYKLMLDLIFKLMSFNTGDGVLRNIVNWWFYNVKERL